jgi:hypothetical protein
MEKVVPSERFRSAPDGVEGVPVGGPDHPDHSTGIRPGALTEAIGEVLEDARRRAGRWRSPCVLLVGLQHDHCVVVAAAFGKAPCVEGDVHVLASIDPALQCTDTGLAAMAAPTRPRAATLAVSVPSARCIPILEASRGCTCRDRQQTPTRALRDCGIRGLRKTERVPMRRRTTCGSSVPVSSVKNRMAKQAQDRQPRVVRLRRGRCRLAQRTPGLERGACCRGRESQAARLTAGVLECVCSDIAGSRSSCNSSGAGSRPLGHTTVRASSSTRTFRKYSGSRKGSPSDPRSRKAQSTSRSTPSLNATRR